MCTGRGSGPERRGAELELVLPISVITGDPYEFTSLVPHTRIDAVYSTFEFSICCFCSVLARYLHTQEYGD
jgi:hypothetical protein